MNYFYQKVLLFAFPYYITHPEHSVLFGISNTPFRQHVDIFITGI
jgi:hypothetical protein